MPRQSISRARPQVEQLEARDVPAGHITVNAATGLVNVLGTARNDSLTVSYGPRGTLNVSLTGGARQTVHLRRSQVREIDFHGNGGYDRFLNRTAVPVFLGTGPSFFQFLPFGGLGPLPVFGGPAVGAAPSSPRPIQVTPVPGLSDAEALILEETNYFRT
ncbi:MAG TPA: hypothetical protein VJ739_03495, partial [Gemmataceae bacterium]|nr:hypothetical protein [Gemmataceae bacterium]